jgi:hypothetical protein
MTSLQNEGIIYKIQCDHMVMVEFWSDSIP